MSKLKVVIKNKIACRIQDLEPGELFKTIKYGSSIVFMAIRPCFYRNPSFEEVYVNAVRLDDGSLTEIDASWDIIPVTGEFHEQ